MKPLTLSQRCELYNNAYSHLGPPNTPLFVHHGHKRSFATAFWFVGGPNISDLYGAYQIEYLDRIGTLFPDATSVVHLFVGSLPPSPKYVRVGLPQGDTKPDVECDAHELSSKLRFRPDLIYADPPYTLAANSKYAINEINASRVVDECAGALQPGGWLVWMDMILPVFSNNKLQLVGGITYIRSTGNHFRVICLFRKLAK